MSYRAHDFICFGVEALLSLSLFIELAQDLGQLSII